MGGVAAIMAIDRTFAVIARYRIPSNSRYVVAAEE
jgi:hypothetical protein